MACFVVKGYEAMIYMEGDLVFGFVLVLKANGFLSEMASFVCNEAMIFKEGGLLLEMASFVCYEAMDFKEGDLVCFVEGDLVFGLVLFLKAKGSSWRWRASCATRR